jgi:sugar lactone lactonase YvrE
MSNRTIFLRWFATVFSMLLLTACMADLFDPHDGKLAVTVKWPQKAGYQIQAIPEGTVRIALTIVGEGLDTPLKTEFTPQGQDTSSEIKEVPIGPKALTAVAYDEQGHQTADGSVTVVVQPNKITTAVLTLDKTEIQIPVVNVSPGPSPSGSPAPSPSPVPDLTIQTVAGDGRPGAVDGYATIDARLKYPKALAYDAAKNVLYIADTNYKLIRKYDVKSTLLTTVAGTAPATEASPSASTAPLFGSSFGTPAGMAVGPDGNLYFADLDYHVIRRLNPNGSVTTVAGAGKPGPAKENVTALEASFYYPVAVAFDNGGAMYVADQFNQKIRRLSTKGSITTIAGTGEAGDAGDGGPGVEAQLNYPTAIALDPKGDYLYIAEAMSHRVRRLHLATGVITPVAGTGKEGISGEGGPALQAQLGLPLALTFDKDGNLLIAEGWTVGLGPEDKISFTNRLLKVTADGKLVRIAGQKLANYGFGGDGEDALKAVFNDPAGLAVDADGAIYISDCYNNRIRALKHGLQPGLPSPEPTPSPLPTPAADATSTTPVK